MDPESLLVGLDDEQRLAVTSDALPLVILAPAGSGKTRVLTRRIAHRVATGQVDARHVLAITFTRKAAAELNERLARLGLRREATTGTFHAVAWALLRTKWNDERRAQPVLLDRKAVILGELLGPTAGTRGRSAAGDVASEIEWAKARMVSPEGYAAAAKAAGRRSTLGLDRVAEVYSAYEARKSKGGLVDFDDLLGLCVQAMERDASFAAAQRWRFRHLFVDELQDVNPLQFRLLEAWRGDRYDVTAVGDPQQAIYGWNGADAGFLLDIHRHWPPAQVIELRRSYRSTPEILDAAASVLRVAGQPAREVHAARPGGRPPVVVGHPTERDEALAVARAVRLGRAPGRPWSDQAVLVRTNAQTTVIVEALRAAGIPHRVRGGSGFLEQPAVKRALRLLRSSDAPLPVALADLEDEVASSRPDDGPSGSAAEADAALLVTLADMGRDYLRLDPTGRASSFVGWLRATVVSEADTAGGGDAVDVATFHAAKGLEWQTVHLAGLEDGIVPLAHARTQRAKAEEARLLYVAMTRAQRDLKLTWAQQRTFGTKVVDRRMSPLLEPLTAPERLERARSLGAGTPRPPVEEWREQLAVGRKALARPTAPEDPAVVALRDWRDVRARAARVDPQSILSDRVLEGIVDASPADVDALGQLDGVGRVLASRFGSDILDALRQGVGSGGPS